MSVFSDMLKNYIHEKDVKVERLANFCKLERSTVYKFINGKREPISAQLVEDLAQYIKLTPTETQQLKEAWKMARMGEDTYYIRKSIEHFLCNFPNKSSVSVRSFTPPPYKFNSIVFPRLKLSAAEFQTGCRFCSSSDFLIGSWQN